MAAIFFAKKMEEKEIKMENVRMWGENDFKQVFLLLKNKQTSVYFYYSLFNHI